MERDRAHGDPGADSGDGACNRTGRGSGGEGTRRRADTHERESTTSGGAPTIPLVALAISGSTALDAVLTASIVVPLVVLGFVIWFFFRAARREDHREATADRSQPSHRDP